MNGLESLSNSLSSQNSTMLLTSWHASQNHTWHQRWNKAWWLQR